MSHCPKCNTEIKIVNVDTLVEIWTRSRRNYKDGKIQKVTSQQVEPLGQPRKVIEIQYTCTQCGADMGENFLMEDIL